jgi:hypothetical protein
VSPAAAAAVRWAEDKGSKLDLGSMRKEAGLVAKLQNGVIELTAPLGQSRLNHQGDSGSSNGALSGSGNSREGTRISSLPDRPPFCWQRGSLALKTSACMQEAPFFAPRAFCISNRQTSRFVFSVLGLPLAQAAQAAQA